MYESDSSASSSYGDHEDMEHFINRCSICFDAKLDLCLDYCRDQYCLDCFQRYIIQTVMSSWGLSVTPITCPVCRESIPQSEWSRFVPNRITELYNKYNTPYRSFMRCCHHCETDMIPCVYNNIIQPSQSRIFCDMLEDLLVSCPDHERHKNHIEHIAIKRWIPIYKRQDWSDPKLPVLFKRIMKDVLTFEKNHLTSESGKAKLISLQFTRFAVKPEVWKQIQFAHIEFFPAMQCTTCSTDICLCCGYDAHPNTCEENMECLLDKELNQDIKQTIMWKLKNSRRCPSCSIMINRDEGCNKVDCSYCGFCFCWACRSPWSEGCGFYRCSILSNSIEPSTSEEKTELGVPNINNIRAKLLANP